MYAYTNIMAALMMRSKTGKGSHIDISMLESMVEWMNYPLYYAYNGASPPPRAGAAHATIYPYGPFLAGDGKTVMLGLQNEREWAIFCQLVLKQPELATETRFASNSKRVEHRQALSGLILEAFSDLSAEQVIERLDQAQIANAHMNEMQDVWQHPQLKARDRWTEVGSPSGSISALKPPGLSNAFSPRMDAVPSLGQHTNSLLRELGLDNSDIEMLRKNGSI
jgi:itaconate CoA-transferase